MIRKETRASLGNSKAGNNLSHIFCHIFAESHIITIPIYNVLGINTTVVHFKAGYTGTSPLDS